MTVNADYCVPHSSVLSVELLLHPRNTAARSPRLQRWLALVWLVIVGSLPTLIVVVVLGPVGASLLISGIAVFVAGLLATIGVLPDYVQLTVRPVQAIFAGPAVAAVGLAALLGLVWYVKFVARVVRRVLPAHETAAAAARS